LRKEAFSPRARHIGHAWERYILIAATTIRGPSARTHTRRHLDDADLAMASMVEVMKLDLHASDQDVLTATLAKLQVQEARTAAEKVDRLMQQYRARGLAVVGSQETLEALANGQVEELLISGAIEETHPEPEEVEAILAPEISDSEGGTESEEPRQASVPDLLVTKAKQTGATVTFIEDGALLESIGGVGAFLRWRE
jgi:peptide subunit release factor 1 (eRF1)